jgi:FtsP/CotA-like multicopper oxidase with cupredoxin domain
LLRLVNLAAAYPVEVTLPCPALVQGVDGQPSDPIESAAGGKFLLGPFGRLDFSVALPETGEPLPILVDTGSGPRPMARFVFTATSDGAAAPAPAKNPLPATVPMQNAVRAEILVADGEAKPAKGRTILSPGSPFPPAAPACLTAPAGRTIVLTLVNQTRTDRSVHWHGFPARLLDTMDDGWKPWWVDSVLIAPGETARIAFLADTPGRWLVSAQAIGVPDDRRFTWLQVR